MVNITRNMKKFNTLVVFHKICNNLLFYPCMRALGRRTPSELSNFGLYFFKDPGSERLDQVHNLIAMSYGGYISCNNYVISSIATDGLGHGSPTILLLSIVFGIHSICFCIMFQINKLIALVNVFRSNYASL